MKHGLLLHCTDEKKIRDYKNTSIKHYNTSFQSVKLKNWSPISASFISTLKMLLLYSWKPKCKPKNQKWKQTKAQKKKRTSSREESIQPLQLFLQGPSYKETTNWVCDVILNYNLTIFKWSKTFQITKSSTFLLVVTNYFLYPAT
jgi:hypothetical protein